MLPEQKIQYLVGQIDAEVLETLNQYSLDADVLYESLLPETVCAVHEAGHQVNVWTVDNVDTAIRMAELGVDFITTNILE